MRENILVCVSNPNHAERLAQRGKILKDAFQGEGYILSVENQKHEDLDFNELQTKFLFESLAEKYGLKMLSKHSEGKRIAKVIADVAQQYKITQIILGQAVQTKLERMVKHSLINELFELLEGVDIHVVEVTRKIHDSSEDWDKGFPAQLVKKGSEYHLTIGEKHEKGIDGIFFKELSSDFSNGFFVIQKDKNHEVVRIHHGVVDSDILGKE
ncbi:universal stress protein [Bacillus sp. ISL-47]|uniref:universal stress protein n=1 Tax=Bacillus sp. ISL-47 TaxID=2819130 RepID=UPI001BE70961|nr:universal stress protein [Bacillus sp. ISL-47]MBT2687496.1 universal stress protein [Bacillus sp. ISL-47]MBT2706508.1 universal stress protein [Pseudomonas sp. ISL-84]